MKLKAVLAELKSIGDSQAAAGMAKYGIKADRALGVSIPKLQGLAKKIGKNHRLADALWSSGIHEARIWPVWSMTRNRSMSSSLSAG